MSDELSPLLSLPLLQPSQAQKHVTHNEALRLLDVLVQLSAFSRNVATPPETPAEGDRYILPAAASGAWAGRGGQVAFYDGQIWDFLMPATGWQAHIEDEDTLCLFNGTDWVSSAERMHKTQALGINTTADAVNRLSVSGQATLLSHEGELSGGHQLKINKATGAETASLLFQTGWSGRAELGTTGSDTFQIKVSPDGMTWRAALQINPASGQASFLPGSAAAPGIAFEGDGDTGIHRPAANQIGLSTGGTRRALLSNTGLQLDVALTGTAVTQTNIDTTSGRLLKVGDFGLGDPGNAGSLLTTPGAADALRGWRLDRVAGSAVLTVGGPAEAASGGTFMTIGYSANNQVQLFMEVAAPGRMWQRHFSAGNWQPWRKIWTSANTTVDSNGFLKEASPILRLFCDHIEEPVQPTHAILHHPATGRYILSGTAGLARAGWQIEVPRDQNGTPLLHVLSEWDGEALVLHTHAPLWSDGGWMAGAPLDVPEGRWIDIRLHETTPPLSETADPFSL